MYSQRNTLIAFKAYQYCDAAPVSKARAEHMRDHDGYHDHLNIGANLDVPLL